MADELPRSDIAADSIKQFSLRRVYLKRANYDAPGQASLLTDSDLPEVDFRIGTSSMWTTDTRVHVMLRLNLKSTVDERLVFQLELDQCGVFDIIGYPADEVATLLRTKCLAYLYPYAREMATSLIGHSGMQNMQLVPLAFSAVHSASMMSDGLIPMVELPTETGAAS